MKMSPVVHFEMPYEDEKRVADFYSKTFGWKMQNTGENMGNYILAGTTPVDKNNMAIAPGAVNGGFYPKSAEGASPIPSVVIQVDDIKNSIEMIRKGGGKVLGEPMEILGIGLYVPFLDTEGNRVGMLQPATR